MGLTYCLALGVEKNKGREKEREPLSNLQSLSSRTQHQKKSKLKRPRRGTVKRRRIVSELHLTPNSITNK